MKLFNRRIMVWLLLIPLAFVALALMVDSSLGDQPSENDQETPGIIAQLKQVVLLPLVINSPRATDPAPGTDPAPTPGPSPVPKPITGIAVMGDSNSDEYRADDDRGGRTYGPVTYNWVEHLAISRNLNFGEWGTRDEPRRTGYEYNWARSSANTSRMIHGGQHTGVARQVAEGKVSHVVIWIGGNDFHLTSGTYEEIYDGSVSDEQLQAKIDSIIENLTLAVDTVLAAGDVRIVVVNFLDKSLTVEAITRFPDEAGRNRVSEAIGQVNDRLAVMAAERGVVVADFNEFARKMETRMENGYLMVGGEPINTFEKGNEPNHLQLRDRPGHFGSVFSGLIANAVLVEPFNQSFGLNIEPLSDDEILRNAGLR